MHYTLYPKGVCSVQIDLDLEDGIVRNLSYTSGCSGNLQAVGRLCEGMEAAEIVDRLWGIRCGSSSTSCGDQLARLLRGVLEQSPGNA